MNKELEFENENVDDNQNVEADDQQSQKDIHSNGFEIQKEEIDQKEDEREMLDQAYKASESSFTLNLGEDKGE